MKPVWGLSYTFDIQLASQALPTAFQANPTLAAGDVKVAGGDGSGAMGALNNITSLPSVSPAASDNVVVTLSAVEMTFDRVLVEFKDAAGAEWFPVNITIEPEAQPGRNQAWTNFPFKMYDTTGAPVTGKTVTCTRSLDGGSYSGGTLANVAEVADGTYKVDFGAGDRNARVVMFRATAPGCQDTDIEMIIP